MQHRMTLSRNEHRPPPMAWTEYDETAKWKKGIRIPVYDSMDKALNKLKRSMLKDGIYEEMSRHERYVKPSEQRRLDKAAGLKKWRKREQSLRDDMVIAPDPITPVHRKAAKKRKR